jgi:hypothetical protein
MKENLGLSCKGSVGFLLPFYQFIYYLIIITDINELRKFIYHYKNVQYYHVRCTVWKKRHLIMELSLIIASQWIAQS